MNHSLQAGDGMEIERPDAEQCSHHQQQRRQRNPQLAIRQSRRNSAAHHGAEESAENQLDQERTVIAAAKNVHAATDQRQAKPEDKIRAYDLRCIERGEAEQGKRAQSASARG